MITATSTEQRTESSCAFLNRPPLRFRKVTDLVEVLAPHRVEDSQDGIPIAVIANGLNLHNSNISYEDALPGRQKSRTSIFLRPILEAAPNRALTGAVPKDVPSSWHKQPACTDRCVEADHQQARQGKRRGTKSRARV